MNPTFLRKIFLPGGGNVPVPPAKRKQTAVLLFRQDSSPPGPHDGRRFREWLQWEQECLVAVAVVVHCDPQPP